MVSTEKGSGVLIWLAPTKTPSNPSSSALTARSRIRATSFTPPLILWR